MCPSSKSAGIATLTRSAPRGESMNPTSASEVQVLESKTGRDAAGQLVVGTAAAEQAEVGVAVTDACGLCGVGEVERQHDLDAAGHGVTVDQAEYRLGGLLALAAERPDRL